MATPLHHMIALIDGDIVAYRCAASCEPTKEKLEREPLDLAILRTDELIYRILSTTQSDKYRIFLSGSENFRAALYPDYKANRRKYRQPEYLQSCREFLVREWDAEVVSGYEADDGIGIAAKGDFVICSIDKDLRQIPGLHYNFVRDEFEEISELDATLNFWKLMLVGDTSDNVRGVDGIGPVKADRILKNLSPKEMEANVLSLYEDKGRFLLNYQLFRVLRDEAEFSQGEREEPTEDSRPEDSRDLSDTNQE